MQTPMRCFNRSYDSPLKKLSNTLVLYSMVEVMDPLVCLNQHASLLGQNQSSHFVIFIYISNLLAMTNKMAAKVLTYELGSPSYGNSKLEKWKNFMKVAY